VSDLNWLFNPGTGVAAIGASLLTLLVKRLVAPYVDAYSRQKGLTDKTDAEVSATIQRFRNSRTSFRRAHLIVDLAVGGQFSNAMSAYFRLTGVVSTDMTHKRSFLDSAKHQELALSGNSVILSARQALGIKDAGDLPRIDDSN
jgi:hypothetical protein